MAREVDPRRRDRGRERTSGTAPPARAEPQQQLAADVGNRALSASLQRDGAGLLPGGVVHPDVQSLIAARRSAGAPLAGDVRSRFEDELGDGLDDVRVHADATADTLARSVSARAFAVGNDVFFARGEYRPGTADGDHLLAHELTHAVQQRGAATTGPLEVTDENEPMEREARQAADRARNEKPG